MVQCCNTLFPILTICSLFGLNTYLYIRVMTVVELKVLFFWWNGSFISCLGFIIWVCFEKKSSIFLWLLLLLSHVFVQNFLGFVQNRIFFVQKTEETPACFFWISRIFYSDSGFFWAFPVFLSERVRFSRLPIRFLRVFSTLSVMILLFLFHQSVFFSVFFW